MKKTIHLIIAIVEIVFGVLFLANYASDIQLGFGLVLTFAGLLAII